MRLRDLLTLGVFSTTIIANSGFARSNEQEMMSMQNTMAMAIFLDQQAKILKECGEVKKEEVCADKKYCTWAESKCERDDKKIGRELYEANLIMLGTMVLMVGLPVAGLLLCTR